MDGEAGSVKRPKGSLTDELLGQEMARYMTPAIFRSACFLLASCYDDKETFESVLSGIKDSYGRTFPADDFVSDMREGVKKLWEMLSENSDDDKQRIFRTYYQISKTTEPDGTKRKKIPRISGGTRFSGSHPSPANRVHNMTMEFFGYRHHFPSVLVLSPELQPLANRP